MHGGMHDASLAERQWCERATGWIGVVRQPVYGHVMTHRDIISLAAAPGWWALYGNPAMEIEVVSYPLVAWALTHASEPGAQRIQGLVYIVDGDGVVEAESARSTKGGNFMGFEFRVVEST